MTHKVIQQAIFKINNEVVGISNPNVESLDDIDILVISIALHHNVSLEEVEVVYENKVVELGETFVTNKGRLCYYDENWNFADVNKVSMSKNVNGLDMFLDYLKIGKVDELLELN
jgi:hypothetical protein